MQDEPEPPRKIYGFKPREFERANPASPSEPSSAPTPPVPDPGIPAADSGKIDVNDLIRAGAGTGKQLGSNSVVNRPNEVHGILRENLQREIAAGSYELGVLDDSKRRRRIRNYWIALVAVDVPLAAYARWVGHDTQAAVIPFVCSIAAIAMFTSYLTWQTFFLRTHY
jgi:hypothetical protein